MTVSHKIRVHRFAVIPGDGIGVEVTAAAVEVLKKVAKAAGTFELRFTTFDWNSDTYLKLGHYIPEDGLRSLRAFDSILLGAVGSPSMSACGHRWHQS